MRHGRDEQVPPNQPITTQFFGSGLIRNSTSTNSTYQGTTSSIQYLFGYERISDVIQVADHRHWDVEEAGVQLRCNLSGPIQQNANIVSNLPFIELKDVLTKRLALPTRHEQCEIKPLVNDKVPLSKA